jgi:hypothetical protein
LVKLSKPPNDVTLADFKSGIPGHFHKFKFFFKSKDDDFGVVKEEIIDDQVSCMIRTPIFCRLTKNAFQCGSIKKLLFLNCVL